MSGWSTVTRDGRRLAWPARDDLDGWRALGNRILQAETLATDLAENAAWDATMRSLVAEGLDYDTFTARRLELLSERLRARKLAQTNLRYRWGFKDRRQPLVQRDIRRYLIAHTDVHTDVGAA
jgi:hypothetical protein